VLAQRIRQLGAAVLEAIEVLAISEQVEDEDFHA